MRHRLGEGKQLPAATRLDQENRYGASFEQVRLHDSPAAHVLAQHFLACAFTIGSDIVFNEGRYRPGSHEGERLLAHELAHVVQQSRDRTGPRSGPAHEAAADASARAVLGGVESVPVGPGAARGLQCEPMTPEEVARLSVLRLKERLVENEREGSVGGISEGSRNRLMAENIQLKRHLADLLGAPRSEPEPPVPAARETDDSARYAGVKSPPAVGDQLKATAWALLAAVADRVKNSKGAEFVRDVRENKTVKTLFDTSHFFELGDARMGFLSGAFGLPFERPEDRQGQSEWDRGQEVAGMLLVAELLTGIVVPGGPGGPASRPSPALAGAGPGRAWKPFGEMTPPLQTTGGGAKSPNQAVSNPKPADPIVKAPTAEKPKDTKFRRQDWEVSTGTWAKLRKDTVTRDPMCAFCQKNPSLTADHVEPLVDAARTVDEGMLSRAEARAGVNEAANLRGICDHCNSSKSGKPAGDSSVDRSWWEPSHPDAALIEHMKRMGRWPY